MKILGNIWFWNFNPNPPRRGVLKKWFFYKLVVEPKLQNSICRTHKEMAKSKRWALYLKNWVSYGDFRRSRYDKISLSPNFQMSISHWNFEIGGQFFACDHNFYRFQNNFLQHKVSRRSFIDFQGVTFDPPKYVGFKRVKTVNIFNCGPFDFWCLSFPPFGLLKLFGQLLQRHILISMSLVYNLPRQGRGSKLCVKGPKETQRHLHITNFSALNNLLQKELLIRALYTHLIEEGGEESGKET